MKSFEEDLRDANAEIERLKAELKNATAEIGRLVIELSERESDALRALDRGEDVESNLTDLDRRAREATKDE